MFLKNNNTDIGISKIQFIKNMQIFHKNKFYFTKDIYKVKTTLLKYEYLSCTNIY